MKRRYTGQFPSGGCPFFVAFFPEQLSSKGKLSEMLITRGQWRDAMLFAAESDGGAAPDSTTDTPASESVTPTPAELAAELERTKAALSAANKEAQQRRLKLEAIEKADQERKDQELSEAQKAAKRAQEAEERYTALAAKHRDAAIKSAVKVAAMAAGFVDADDAVKLADLSLVTMEEDEQVTGAKEAVAALAKAKPHLLAATRPGAPNINATEGSIVPMTAARQEKARVEHQQWTRTQF